YVGNVHLQVTEALLQEVFQSTGPVEGCKLIRKEKVSFLSYFHTYASNSCSIKLKLKYDLHLSFLGFAIAIPCEYAGLANPLKLIGRMPVGKERTRQVQFQIISCTKILDARVMWDQKTGRSRGFGFVSFRNQQDAQSAINDLTGKWLGSRQIRCNWATKGANTSEDKQNSDSKSVVDLANASAGA
ncbi:hypothetical protein BHE74_00030762, partial [Ensete ventricosum]